MDEDVTRERRRRLLQTFCWFLLTLLLALFIPDIGRVISVIGGLAACFIFVFPGREKASWLAGGRRLLLGFSAAGWPSSPFRGLDGLLVRAAASSTQLRLWGQDWRGRQPQLPLKSHLRFCLGQETRPGRGSLPGKG